MKSYSFNKLWATYKYLFLCGSSIVLWLIIAIGMAWPAYEQHLSITQEEKVLQKKLEVLQCFAIKHNPYEEFHQNQLKEIRALSSRLPAEFEGQDMLKDFHQLAKASSLRLDMSQSEQQVVKDNLQARGLMLKAVGNYEAILQFLTDVERDTLAGLTDLQLEVKREGQLVLQGKGYNYVYSDRKNKNI